MTRIPVILELIIQELLALEKFWELMMMSDAKRYVRSLFGLSHSSGPLGAARLHLVASMQGLPKWGSSSDMFMLEHVQNCPYQRDPELRWSDDVRRLLSELASVSVLSVEQCARRWSYMLKRSRIETARADRSGAALQHARQQHAQQRTDQQQQQQRAGLAPAPDWFLFVAQAAQADPQ